MRDIKSYLIYISMVNTIPGMRDFYVLHSVYSLSPSVMALTVSLMLLLHVSAKNHGQFHSSLGNSLEGSQETTLQPASIPQFTLSFVLCQPSEN